MKRAVSVSIGSTKRDKKVEVALLGEKVSLERIGTDGDMQKAAALYSELDGKVDAFGMGGAELGFLVNGRWFRMHSVQFLVEGVTKTPVVDGNGFKAPRAKIAFDALEKQIGDEIHPKRVLLPSAIDRYSLARAFIEGGYECVFGDLMFALGIPFVVKTLPALHLLARILLPIVGHLPFDFLYPTGESQELRTPKWVKHFRWATVIAGDSHYMTRYMPDDMQGKVIVTNTTTEADRALFKKAGVKYLLTTTPILDGRSFGTNMMESGLVAAMGWTDPVDYANPSQYFKAMQGAIDQLGGIPEVQRL